MYGALLETEIQILQVMSVSLSQTCQAALMINNDLARPVINRAAENMHALVLELLVRRRRCFLRSLGFGGFRGSHGFHGFHCFHGVKSGASDSWGGRGPRSHH